jgi:hypothetical protein
MSKVSIQGDASGTGTLTIAAPNTNSNYTLTLPTNTGTVMTSASNTFAGGLTLGGDLTLDSNGIYLGGTGAANYLDDYEEGTWTPNFYVRDDRSRNVFTSYNAAYGYYKKIGQVVHCFLFVVGGTTKLNNPSDDVCINLPFTSENTYQQGAGGFNYIRKFPDLSDTYRQFTGFIDQNGDELCFRRLNTNNSLDNVGCDDLSANAEISMNFTYMTAS